MTQQRQTRQHSSQQKDKKIEIYYPAQLDNGQWVRKFIHRVGGLWAYVRDIRQSVGYQATTTDIDNTVLFVVNFRQELVDNYKDMVIKFRGKTYKITQKPDEYEYIPANLKVQAEMFVDNTRYSQDKYKE